jgi:hypothetical protein
MINGFNIKPEPANSIHYIKKHPNLVSDLPVTTHVPKFIHSVFFLA